MGDDTDSQFKPSYFWSSGGEPYNWPRDTDERDIEYVYHGRLQNLPASTSRIVRIFLSSTFTDTVVERNLLMKTVFPHMRQYCRDKHDLDFQVVDMRWGVRDEASADHSASEMCVREIKTCNAVSLGPTFVTLLSERYGSRPLPVRIPKDEMEHLEREIRRTSEKDWKLLSTWYLLDENAIPSEYVLKPLVDFEEFESLLTSDEEKQQQPNKTKKPKLQRQYSQLTLLDSASEDMDDEETKTWESPTLNAQTISREERYKSLLDEGRKQFYESQPLLKKILRKAASQCVTNKTISKEQAAKFTYSVTEEEIIHGITKNERRRDRCLAFIRKLDNINIKHTLAKRFTDVENGDIDKEAQELMMQLRDKTIPNLLPKENIFHFQTEWTDAGGINEATHAKYLEEFCESFKAALKDQIDRGVAISRFTTDSLFTEILEHGHQCIGKLGYFYGREKELDAIKKYLQSDETTPFVIWGESGCGKTSVVAKTAQMTEQWLGNSKDLLIVTRFLGTTPDSSTIYKTLHSVSEQIIKLCNLNEQFPQLPKEFTDLTDIFIDILGAVPENKRLVLLLDSLDQLTSANSAHSLQWLPLSLPSNVKLVLSVLPHEHAILDTLRTKVPNPKYYIEVENLQHKTSDAILHAWLKTINRQISNSQEILIKTLIEKDIRPLYLRLILDEVETWKSFDKPQFNCNTIEACLMRLYSRIEISHGKTLVSKALGYLSASTNGLTDLEMEDILSLDEDVLTDVFQFHIPPVRRLPSILLARIRRDLDQYIVYREADGTKVLAWYHRQFIEQARIRFLKGSKGYHSKRANKNNKDIYLLLCEYFAGMWAGETPKPFKYNEYQCKKLGMDDPNGLEIRHVSEQPTIYRDTDGSIDLEKIRYNLRKISELVGAFQALDVDEDIMRLMVKHICLNPEFIAAFVKNKPWDEVSEFMTTNSRESDIDTSAITKTMKKNAEGKLDDDENAEIQKAHALALDGIEGLVLQVSTIHQCLLLSYISVVQNPTYFAVDIAGRMLVYKGVFKGIDDWIEYCDTEGRQLCALVPPHLQLDTPGGELLFIISNHDGPVNIAMWSNQDDNICISLSSKLVVVSLELGQVLIDTRPRSVPKHDFFKQAVMIGDKIVVALLNYKRWMYVFDLENQGEVVKLLKFEDIFDGNPELPEFDWYTFRIDGIVTASDIIGKSVVILYSKAMPYLFAVKEDYSVEIVKVQNTKNVICAFKQGESLFVLNEENKIIGLRKDDDVEQEIAYEFQLEVVAYFTQELDNGEDDEMEIVIALANGDLIWLKLNNMSALKKHQKYGKVHDIYHRCGNYKSEKRFTSVCTTTHLQVFVFKGDPSSDASDVEADVESDVGYQQLFRVKKRYDKAIISSSMLSVMAVTGGEIDLFKISEAGNTYIGQFFTKIDAHSGQINKILDTEKDILFLTASDDSTLKFWMTARAGVTSMYIPKFDKSEKPIEKIIPVKESVFTFAIGVRSIPQWSSVTGRITHMYDHRSKHGQFLDIAICHKKNRLSAINTKGHLYIWDLPSSTSSRTLKRKVTKHGGNKVQPAEQVICLAVIDLELQMNDNTEDVQLISVASGLWLRIQDVVCYFPEDALADVRKYDVSKCTGIHQHPDGKHILIINNTDRGGGFVVNAYNAEDPAAGVIASTQFDIYADPFRATLSSGEVVLYTDSNILVWNPQSDSKRMGSIPDEIDGFVIEVTQSGVGILYNVSIGTYHCFQIQNGVVCINKTLRRLTRKSDDDLKHVMITPDGKYILLVSNERYIRLIRYSDGKLLANYTMYDQVTCLSVSPNSWYVNVGTTDKRLFVLVIADPKERDHDMRIEYVRRCNPGLSVQQALGLIGEANVFEDSDDSSDEEAMMMKAERRLERDATQKQKSRNAVICLEPDDESSPSESEDQSRPISRSMSRQPTMLHESEYASAFDGQMLTSQLCSIH